MMTNELKPDAMVEAVARPLAAQIMSRIRGMNIGSHSCDETQDEFEALILTPMIIAAMKALTRAEPPRAQPDAEVVEGMLRSVFCEGVAWVRYGANSFEDAVADVIASKLAALAALEGKSDV